MISMLLLLCVLNMSSIQNHSKFWHRGNLNGLESLWCKIFGLHYCEIGFRQCDASGGVKVWLCVARSEGVAADATELLLHAAGALMPL
jgi:hypothetical protein